MLFARGLTRDMPHLPQAKSFFQAMVAEQSMRALGISGVADTVVGDDLLRGVSGGQKKRVAVGEVMVSRGTINPPIFSCSR